MSREDDVKGRIAPGQYADFAALSADYFSVADAEIRRHRVGAHGCGRQGGVRRGGVLAPCAAAAAGVARLVAITVEQADVPQARAVVRSASPQSISLRGSPQLLVGSHRVRMLGLLAPNIRGRKPWHDDRPTLSEKGLLTPDNCVVALIDLQPQMLFGVSNFDRQTIINNNVALAKAAQSVRRAGRPDHGRDQGFSGYMWPQVQAVFPGQTPIERSSMNSWDDANFVARDREDRPQEDRADRASGPRPASPCRPSR